MIQAIVENKSDDVDVMVLVLLQRSVKPGSKFPRGLAVRMQGYTKGLEIGEPSELDEKVA